MTTTDIERVPVILNRDLTPGQIVRVELPYSEVCMHLGIAGQVRKVMVLEDAAQILNDDGTKFSIPITHGEAGIYRQPGTLYAYVTDMVHTGNCRQRLARLEAAQTAANEGVRYQAIRHAKHRLVLACSTVV